MKKLIFSLLFALPVMAQDGFKNDNGNLVWQYTYPSVTNMQAMIDSKPDLQVTAFINDTYTGLVNKVKNTCTEGSPVMRNDCSFDFEIRSENGNYIAVISNIKIIEVMGPMRARTIESRCEKYFVDAALKLKKDVRTQKDMKCLDSFLTSVFSDAITTTVTLSAN
ncbi:hypothetical protein [Flavobacterium sp. NRK1]|uniref:hypothetical protein n=1 Tax=Flavobacterium sp. NRK1 TaxID=2954929 RepID=UPI002092C48D|nr:hypothetical protein [Flavobacterium sp. NRK1]MCO6148447.1 hypothetical protein [Flavobacterium sp. NRK1]